MTSSSNHPISAGALINHHWETGEGAKMESLCPVDDAIVWQGNQASAGQVDEAFHSARTAFASWWDQPTDVRLEIVQRFATLVTENADELATQISHETGKPIWESKTEAGAVAGKVGVSIEAFRNRRDTTSFAMGEMTAVTRFKPHGVVGVLGPFNFPAHLPNGHIVPALIAGNTIVFKPSEQAPSVGQWMMKKWIEAGLPPGVINMVQGGRDVGSAVASHPQIDGLLFTGSSSAGKALHKTFAPFPHKILALEMGGNNPLIVDTVNDVQAAAYLTILSAYFTAGQRCSCARRLILVNNSWSEKFIEVLREMIGKIRVGFFSDDPEPFMGTVISGEQGKRVLAAQQALIDQGAESLVAIQRQRDCDALLSPGLIDVTNVSGRGDEEVFGPLLNVIRVKDFQAAIDEANNTAYGLSAALLSDSSDRFNEFIHQIRAGVVNWNRQTTGATGKMPFGGCGLSGNHRPSAYFAADYCSFPVASLQSETLTMPESTLTGIEL